MAQGGNAYSPEVQLPIRLDELVISARALPLAYDADDADALEDRSREWLGRFALVAAQQPALAPYRRQVERAIRSGRDGDAKADRAVKGHAFGLIAAAEEARRLGLVLLELLDEARRHAEAARQALALQAEKATALLSRYRAA